MKKYYLAVTASAVLAFSLPLFAQSEPESTHTPGPSDVQRRGMAKLNTTTMTTSDNIEMHEKMAAAHRKMSECLKSGKTLAECREEFTMTCRESGMASGCDMMSGRRTRVSRQTEM